MVLQSNAPETGGRGQQGPTAQPCPQACRNFTPCSTVLKKAQNVWHGQGDKLTVSFPMQRGGKPWGPALPGKPTIPSCSQLPDPPCFPQPCPAAPGRMAEAYVHFQGLTRTSQVTLSPSACGENGSSSWTTSSLDLSAGHFIAPLNPFQALSATPYQR